MAGRRALQVCLMLGGLIAWAAQFTILYGATSTLCGRGWADAMLFGAGVVPATIVATTLAALGATALVLLHSIREHKRLDAVTDSAADMFLNRATFLISAFSLVAIAWHGLPALILPACA